MKRLSIFAPAKVNLYLHVTERREDGYHNLDSLVVFADIGDQLTIEPATDFSFYIDGPYADSFDHKGKDSSPNSSNLVVRAAWAMAQLYKKTLPYKMTLTKNLPLSSGLGGGSADAAACLWGLAKLWNIKHGEAQHKLMRDLGSDIPVCYACQPAHIGGTGDILTDYDTLPDMPAILVNPNLPLLTANVFNRLSEDAHRDHAPPGKPIADYQDLISTLKARHNSLLHPALLLQPDIETVIAAIAEAHGCLLSRMSGSGASCFGLFENFGDAQGAANDIQNMHPEWWVQPCWLNRVARY